MGFSSNIRHGTRQGLTEIRRTRLLERLTREFCPGTLLLLTAGPGTGKTWLVDQLVRELGEPAVAIDLKRLGSDVVIFVQSIEKAFCRLWPDLCERHEHEQVSRQDFDALNVTNQLLDKLAVEGSSPGIMVIDNCHLIAGRTGWQDVVSIILDRLPSFLSLVLISRTSLELKQIPALKVQGRVTSLRDADVCFDRQESLQFLHENVPDLQDAFADKILDRVKGWPAALALISLDIRDRPGHIAMEAVVSGDLFDYLQYEVFSSLGPEMQTALCIASCIEPFDLELLRLFSPLVHPDEVCSLLTGMPFSDRAILASGKEHLRFSSLFSSFLKQISPAILGDDMLMGIHERAAEFFEQDGQIDRAVHHYVIMGRWHDVIRLILAHQRKWLETCLPQELIGWIDSIPGPLMRKFPRLYLIRGMAHLYLGQLLQAETALSDAFDCLRQGSNERMEAGCRLCEVLLLNGKAREAEELAAGLARQSKIFSRYRAEAMVFEAIALHQLCRFEECGKRWRQINRIAKSRFLPIDEATRCYLTAPKAAFYNLEKGEFEESEKILDHSITVFKRTDPRKRLAWTLVFKGVLKLELHQYAEALSWFREAEAVSRATNRSVHAMSMAFLAFALSESGNMEEAGRWLEHADEAKTSDPTLWVEVLCRLVEARLASESFNRASALQQAWNLASQRDMLLLQAFTGFTAFSIRRDLPDILQVMYLLQKVAASCRKWSVAHRGIRSLLYLNVVCEETESEENQADFSRAFECIRKKDQGFLLTADPYIDGLGLSLKALRQGIERDYLFDLWHAWGESGCDALVDLFHECTPDLKMRICAHWQKMGYRPALVHIPRAVKSLGTTRTAKRLKNMAEKLWKLPPEPLHVRLLGNFVLKRGNTVIADALWKRQTAKDLFKFLCLHADTVFTQEQLLDILWPETDPQKARSGLWSAVTAIRSALEPELTTRAKSRYILCINKTYRLSLPPGSTLDIRLFEHEAEKGFVFVREEDTARASIHLERALELYGDDLLPENLYSDWCAEERERLRLVFIRVLKNMGEIYFQRRDMDKCISAMYRVIGLDPWDEEAYLNLMKFYVLMGNDLKAVEIFRLCSRQLEEELGIGPNKKLQDLFERIMKRRSGRTSKKFLKNL